MGPDTRLMLLRFTTTRLNEMRVTDVCKLTVWVDFLHRDNSVITWSQCGGDIYDSKFANIVKNSG